MTPNQSDNILSCNQSLLVPLNCNFSIQVAYLYTGLQSILGPNDTVGTDAFQYVLIDAEGRRSLPSVFNIIVKSALQAIPSTVSFTHPLIQQEKLTNITVSINWLF